MKSASDFPSAGWRWWSSCVWTVQTADVYTTLSLRKLLSASTNSVNCSYNVFCSPSSSSHLFCLLPSSNYFLYVGFDASDWGQLNTSLGGSCPCCSLWLQPVMERDICHFHKCQWHLAPIPSLHKSCEYYWRRKREGKVFFSQHSLTTSLNMQQKPRADIVIILRALVPGQPPSHTLHLLLLCPFSLPLYKPCSGGFQRHQSQRHVHMQPQHHMFLAEYSGYFWIDTLRMPAFESNHTRSGQVRSGQVRSGQVGKHCGALWIFFLLSYCHNYLLKRVKTKTGWIDIYRSNMTNTFLLTFTSINTLYTKKSFY